MKDQKDFKKKFVPPLAHNGMYWHQNEDESIVLRPQNLPAEEIKKIRKHDLMRLRSMEEHFFNKFSSEHVEKDLDLEKNETSLFDFKKDTKDADNEKNIEDILGKFPKDEQKMLKNSIQAIIDLRVIEENRKLQAKNIKKMLGQEKSDLEIMDLMEISQNEF